ncbi:MAG: Asp-tRNA(Asn)/Glu-tRNA(Gln) amidotransferase subunit GatC [Acidimicrobiia bacterium]
MPVEIDIAKVARLARLELSPEELDHYGTQLKDILEHAAAVQQLATEDVPPTSHPMDMVNAFRRDETRPPLHREDILDQAPDATDGFFRVPRILDE